MVKNSLYILLIFLIGCSELVDKTVPTQPSVNVHPTNFFKPSLHGDFAKSKNYDLSLCKTCHGVNYSGGTSGYTCNNCHKDENGPENCYTCHGDKNNLNFAPPRDLSDNSNSNFVGVGAHQVHLVNTTISKNVDCNSCHIVPEKLNDENHLGNDNKAEIIFSNLNPTNANYNSTDASCSNTYCHGNFNNGNKSNIVKWTDGVSAVQCGSCHGDITKSDLSEKSLPKNLSNGGFHPNEKNCVSCHKTVIDSNYNIINKLKHINGQNDFN